MEHYGLEIINDTDELEKLGLDGKEYAIGTDEEADEACEDYILDMVWAFNPSFLSAHIPALSEKQIAKLQEDCEDANEGLLGLIKDKDHFVKDAISCDGRGHFLSHYDGEEVELKDGLFAYRLY